MYPFDIIKLWFLFETYPKVNCIVIKYYWTSTLEKYFFTFRSCRTHVALGSRRSWVTFLA